MIGKNKLEFSVSSPWLGKFVEKSLRTIGKYGKGCIGGVPNYCWFQLYFHTRQIPHDDHMHDLHKHSFYQKQKMILLAAAI